MTVEYVPPRRPEPPKDPGLTVDIWVAEILQAIGHVIGREAPFSEDAVSLLQAKLRSLCAENQEALRDADAARRVAEREYQTRLAAVTALQSAGTQLVEWQRRQKA